MGLAEWSAAAGPGSSPRPELKHFISVICIISLDYALRTGHGVSNVTGLKLPHGRLTEPFFPSPARFLPRSHSWTMAYIAPIHRPSSIRHAVQARLFGDEESLVIA